MQLKKSIIYVATAIMIFSVGSTVRAIVNNVQKGKYYTIPLQMKGELLGTQGNILNANEVKNICVEFNYKDRVDIMFKLKKNIQDLSYNNIQKNGVVLGIRYDKRCFTTYGTSDSDSGVCPRWTTTITNKYMKVDSDKKGNLFELYALRADLSTLKNVTYSNVMQLKGKKLVAFKREQDLYKWMKSKNIK